MYQILNFDNPIPSCEIHELNFVDGKWVFVYALLTPVKLTNENEQELLVYEYISDLKLVTLETVNLKSINLRVKTLDEYLKLLYAQMKTDVEYREMWKAKNPTAEPNKLKLLNQNYSHNDLSRLGVTFIASILEKLEGNTVFTGI